MSYISEALKKAQEEKDRSCLHYGNILKDAPTHEPPRTGKRIVGFIALAATSVLILAILVWNVNNMGNLVSPQQVTKPKAAVGVSQFQTSVQATVPEKKPEMTDGLKSKEWGIIFQVKDRTNIRAKRAINSKIQGKIRAGQKVKVDFPEDDWYAVFKMDEQVRNEGKALGYIYAPLLSRDSHGKDEKSNSTEAAGFYTEALGKQRENNMTAAEDLYNKVLAIEPNHVYALNNLGVIYMAKKKSDRAVELFNRALTLKRGYVDPYYNLACLYAQRSELGKSIEHLKLAAAINPEVMDWARNDTDLRAVSNTDAFKKLMEEKVH